jgi:phage-related holin
MINSLKNNRQQPMNPDHLDLTQAFVVNTATITGASLALTLANQAYLFQVLTILMIADFLLGIGASYQLGDEITSRRMKTGVLSKLALVVSVGSTCVVLHTFYGVSGERFLSWLFWFFCMAELYSIWGNFDTIRTGERKPEIEVVSIVVGKIRSWIESALGLDKSK